MDNCDHYWVEPRYNLTPPIHDEDGKIIKRPATYCLKCHIKYDDYRRMNS